MSNLKDKLKQEIESLMEEAELRFLQGEAESSIQLLEQAWDKLPRDKYSYDESYFIIWHILIITVSTHNLEKMNYWIKHFMFAAPTRRDFEDRAFWAGKVSYENSNMKDAYEYFEIANEHSGGRCFVEEDTKYKIFFIEEAQKYQ